MKHFLVFLLLVVSFHVPEAVHAQDISLLVKDASLENVFNEIHKQTGYNFLYASRLVAQAPKVTIQISHANIEQVLDLVFKGLKLQYEINNRTVVIKATGKSLSLNDKGAPSPNNNNIGVTREGHIFIKVTGDRTIIYMQEDYELVRNNNGCLLFMSSVALGDCKKPMQNKCIREIEVVKEGDEFVINIYGATVGQIEVLRARIDLVKVVLLTDLNLTSAKVWMERKYKSDGKPKVPVIKKEV